MSSSAVFINVISHCHCHCQLPMFPSTSSSATTTTVIVNYHFQQCCLLLLPSTSSTATTTSNAFVNCHRFHQCCRLPLPSNLYYRVSGQCKIKFSGEVPWNSDLFIDEDEDVADGEHMDAGNQCYQKRQQNTFVIVLLPKISPHLKIQECTTLKYCSKRVGMLVGGWSCRHRRIVTTF